MSEREQMAAFYAWLEAAPEGMALHTSRDRVVWQAACEWATERAAKRIAELTAERDKARRYCSVAAYDMAGFAETLKESPEAFPRTTHDLMETSEFMQLAGEGREDGTVYDDELSKEKARIAELEAALEVFDDALGEDDPGYQNDHAVIIKLGRTTVILSLGDFRRARAVLSQEKQHD